MCDCKKSNTGIVKGMGKAEFEEMQATQNKHFWFCGRLQILEKVFQSLKLSPNTKILEIGCGTGANLGMLSKFGNLSAIELDDGAREYAKQNSKIDVKKGFLPDGLNAIEDETFDVICLFDVIEHLKDDKTSIVALRKFLNNEGKVVITVPAYQWLFSQHDARMGHYRRYTITMLRELLENAGYEVKFLSYMNTILFPIMLLSRLFVMFSKRDTGTKLPCNFINKLFLNLFLIERHWLPEHSFLFGGSVIAVAKVKHLN